MPPAVADAAHGGEFGERLADAPLSRTTVLKGSAQARCDHEEDCDYGGEDGSDRLEEDAPRGWEEACQDGKRQKDVIPRHSELLMKPPGMQPYGNQAYLSSVMAAMDRAMCFSVALSEIPR